MSRCPHCFMMPDCALCHGIEELPSALIVEYQLMDIEALYSSVGSGMSNAEWIKAVTELRKRHGLTARNSTAGS